MRAGLELAQRLGATVLADRAHEELVATGARPRRLVLSGVDSLTPSERRIAAMAAEGLSNREIAQALFVTLRTVEMHLSNAFRKLDVSSRTQLPAALASSAARRGRCHHRISRGKRLRSFLRVLPVVSATQRGDPPTIVTTITGGAQMSPSQPSNIAARMGRWSAQHRKKAVLGWLAFVVIAVIAGMTVGMRMLSSTDSLTGESAVAQRILSDAGYGDTADETVLVQSSTHTLRDPQFRETVRATVHAVSGQQWVSDVRSPLDRGGAMLVSRDGHSALVQFNVRGDMMQTMDRVAPVLRAVAGRAEVPPGIPGRGVRHRELRQSRQ